MSNPESNRTFKTNLLAMSLRYGVAPSLALSMLAGTATAQDSSGFGLLAALKSQSQSAQQPAADGEPAFPQDLEFDEQDPGFGEQMSGDDLYAEDYDTAVGDTGGDDIGELNGSVDVSEYDLVDLHVNNEDLGNILQLLSIQSQRNIISSPDVKASITADLYGVTFYEALDAILHVNGYGYVEKGNFIYVYTAEELAEFEALSRQPITRIIDLDYLNATDAAEFAKMMLSETGSITSNAATEPFVITDGVPSGADNYANSATIVVTDYEANVDEIQALIAELDTKPAQILVEATILQTTLNEANAFGVDFALIQNLDFSDFLGTGGPLNVVDGLINGRGETIDGTATDLTGSDGSGVQSNAGNTSGPATLKAGFVNGDVGVFLRVLDEVTDVTVVSNPKLLTLNRQPARVLVGTRVGYLNTTTTDTSTTQSVEFLDVGTQLAVRPFVSKSGLIRLELRPQVSNVRLRQVSDNTGSTVTIPDEDTTELNTNVMVRDGQTVVLGGLFTETTTAARRQVPVLGDIPLVGSAFKGYDDSTVRSEIIFLITPSIVNDTALAEVGEMSNQYVEHARYGARKGLLPWSRERRVGQLLISARDLAEAGRVEEALSKVDRALRLSPMSPEARELRSRLTGEMRTMPSRSIMEGIFHNELDYGEMSEAEATGVDPFVTPVEVGIEEPVEVFEQVEPEASAVEGDSFAEVPVEPVSDATGEGSSDQTEGFDSFEQEQFAWQEEPGALDGGLSGPENYGSDSSEQAQASESGSDFVEVPVEQQGPSVASEGEANPFWGLFEQMKAVVTGEQTEVQDLGAEQITVVKPVDGGGLESAEQSETFTAVADGFTGQLVIPLPSGGALHLDWPLGYDYVVREEEPEGEIFTEVPTVGDDFADFNE